MSLINIATFNNATEAYLLKAKLESEGIPAFIFDEQMISLNPLLSNSLHGIKLKVDEKYKDKALTIMHQINNAPISHNGEILHCPKCQSVNIENDFKATRSLKELFSLLVSLLFTTHPLTKHSYYRCKDCGHVFKP